MKVGYGPAALLNHTRPTQDFILRQLFGNERLCGHGCISMTKDLTPKTRTHPGGQNGWSVGIRWRKVIDYYQVRYCTGQ